MISEEVELVGGPENIEVSKSLQLSCKNAAARYKENLKRKRENSELELENAATKKKMRREIIEIEEQKRHLMKEAETQQLALTEKIEALKKLQSS